LGSFNPGTSLNLLACAELARTSLFRRASKAICWLASSLISATVGGVKAEAGSATADVISANPKIPAVSVRIIINRCGISFEYDFGFDMSTLVRGGSLYVSHRVKETRGQPTRSFVQSGVPSLRISTFQAVAACVSGLNKTKRSQSKVSNFLSLKTVPEGGEKDMRLLHKIILGCVAAAGLAVASPAQAGDYYHCYWHHHCHHHHHHHCW